MEDDERRFITGMCILQWIISVSYVFASFVDEIDGDLPSELRLYCSPCATVASVSSCAIELIVDKEDEAFRHVQIGLVDSMLEEDDSFRTKDFRITFISSRLTSFVGRLVLCWRPSMRNLVPLNKGERGGSNPLFFMFRSGW